MSRAAEGAGRASRGVRQDEVEVELEGQRCTAEVDVGHVLRSSEGYRGDVFPEEMFFDVGGERRAELRGGVDGEAADPGFFEDGEGFGEEEDFFDAGDVVFRVGGEEAVGEGEARFEGFGCGGFALEAAEAAACAAAAAAGAVGHEDVEEAAGWLVSL
ncbi:uncharacterized protein MYCGRDRAFT_96177 [Zymoseptoria tritici IPO323]|uniref:Uncharacterized protein n=1 Tax=Zymoseptoria tritici (strain CBS 115943 / IPO323) TaxID=336722 RepID=F9XKM8_ZYMTI|nr:uncharacterized protein MYCGRDRAFT_96177 [Zymoseptoria tritici IPO323]EGP84128.1 hypothetical protein MYCGRDRAFT_96177 [Zymoseptoria tritici IPO323]